MKCPYCNKEFSKEDAKIRSTPQNKYYWGVVIPLISEHTGFTREEVHDILKAKFNKDVLFVETKKGVEQVIVHNSTTVLTTVEFEQFLTAIREWASMELGIFIPEPNEEIL